MWGLSVCRRCLVWRRGGAGLGIPFIFTVTVSTRPVVQPWIQTGFIVTTPVRSSIPTRETRAKVTDSPGLALTTLFCTPTMVQRHIHLRSEVQNDKSATSWEDCFSKARQKLHLVEVQSDLEMVSETSDDYARHRQSERSRRTPD